MLSIKVRGSFGTHSCRALLWQLFDGNVDLTPHGVPDILVVTNLLAYPSRTSNSYLEEQEKMLQEIDEVLDSEGTVVFNHAYRFLCLREREHPNFHEFQAIHAPEYLLPGNRAGEVYAAAACAAEGRVPDTRIETVMRQFRGAAGHFELVTERNGVRYFNNACSSIPSNAVMSLMPFTDRITMITGGDSGGTCSYPFSGLALMIVSYVETLILYGDTADAIEYQVREKLKRRTTKLFILRAESIEEAAVLARAETPSGTSVLFSPAIGGKQEDGELFRKGVLS